MIHVVVTGGHHNSALVVASELVHRRVKVSWVGHIQAASGDLSPSAEYLEVTAAKIPFYNLVAGKLNRATTLRDLLLLPTGLLRAYRLLRRQRPNAILSFGGYLGASCALAGWLLRIPIYLHEQTVVAGKANLLTSRLAKRIFLTWDSSKRFFPLHKSRVVGLPLRPSLLSPSRLDYFDNSLPTVVILGGKLGSHALNSAVLTSLTPLLSHYNLIHQTGTNTTTGDLARANALRSALPPSLASRYIVRGYIGQEEIGSVLGSSDCYLGRAGAHITYELALLGLPAVLVPYLLTHQEEQLANAKFLELQGIAEILPEVELNKQTLLASLGRRLLSHPKPLHLPRDAAKTIATEIITDLKSK